MKSHIKQMIVKIFVNQYTGIWACALLGTCALMLMFYSPFYSPAISGPTPVAELFRFSLLV